MLISRGIEESGLFTDYCPFSQGDVAEYEIWGEWQGQNYTLDYGNNTGLQKFIILNRTQSEITIFETKSEEINGVFKGLVSVWPIDACSYWIYNTTTRNLKGTDFYAWLWIQTDNNEKVNCRIEIFDYIFQITEKREFNYFEYTRSAWVAIYNESSDDLINALDATSFELWYDAKTGLMLYYIVRFNAYDNQGKKVEWSFYSTRLNFTSINLNMSYVLTEDKAHSKNVVMGSLFPAAIILAILTLVLFRFKPNKRKKVNYFADSEL